MSGGAMLAVQWRGLECPGCLNHTVEITTQEIRPARYRAYCVQCKWEFCDLAEGGTLREAVDEWQALVKGSAQVRALLGVNNVNEQLPLILDEDAFLGVVTPWFNGATQPPRRVGWYDTRPVMSAEELELRQRQNSMPDILRRWWDGEVWSRPVWPEDTEEEAAAAKKEETHKTVSSIEWRGSREKVTQ